MAITRWDPWSEIARIRRELDSMFTRQTDEWMPAADVTRSDDSLEITLDLPGMTSEDVKVEIRDQQLVISGSRKQERDEKHEGVVTRERIFGSFVRAFTLPAGVDVGDVHARFTDGVLTVTVAVPAQPEAKTIEIHSGEPAHA